MTPGARRADGEANSPRLSRFSRLSTGFKLFLILSLALLPLGLIAFFATLQSSRTADLDRQAQVRIALTESTRKIAATVAGDVALVSAAMKSMIERPEDVEPALREARRLKDRTVFMDFRTDPTENVFPMVKAGAGITEMLLSADDL